MKLNLKTKLSTKAEDLNRYPYIWCFDKSKSEYVIHRLVDQVDNLNEGKHWLSLSPVDVHDDGKYFRSETMRIKENCNIISVEKGCLVLIGKGMWSKDHTIGWILPPTHDRFPDGINKLSDDDPFKRFLYEQIDQVGYLGSIVEGQNLMIKKSSGVIKENDYKNINNASEMADFFRRQKESIEGGSKENERRKDDDKFTKFGKEKRD